jgi:hypothetical protein
VWHCMKHMGVGELGSAREGKGRGALIASDIRAYFTFKSHVYDGNDRAP